MSFAEKTTIMDSTEVRRALRRIAHEIVEANKGTDDLILLGIQRRGVPLAKSIQESIFKLEDVEVPRGSIDITFYRDDLSTIGPAPRVSATDMSMDVTD
jgi:pyrimidine operon attenuation protein/uracil phosphoribosyltransferase